MAGGDIYKEEKAYSASHSLLSPKLSRTVDRLVISHRSHHPFSRQVRCYTSQSIPTPSSSSSSSSSACSHIQHSQTKSPLHFPPQRVRARPFRERDFRARLSWLLPFKLLPFSGGGDASLVYEREERRRRPLRPEKSLPRGSQGRNEGVRDQCSREAQQTFLGCG